MFLALVLALLAPLRPYLIQLSVDDYIAQHMFQGLIMISVLQVGILMLESVLRFSFSYLTAYLGQHTVHLLRLDIFKKITAQPLQYFDQSAVGTLTTRSVNDMEAVQEVFSEGIIAIVSDVLIIVTIIGVMFYTDWQLSLICLSTLPLIIAATYWFKEQVRKSFQQVRQAVSALNAFAQEHIYGMAIVQAFGAERREAQKFDHLNQQHRNAHIKAIFAYSVFFPMVEIILAIALGLLVWWGAKRMLHYEASAGVIIAFVMYLNLLFRPLRMLADKFNALQMGIIAAQRIFEIIDRTEDESLVQVHEQAYPIEGAIAFEHVHFAYTPDKAVLQDLSFSMRAGETLAIVGPTGAGKSSIVSLINRLYAIQRGTIKIDGRSIYDFTLDSLRSQVAVVLQEVFLFSGTILENLRLHNPAISLAQVQECCKQIGIHDFIMRLPGQYEFNVRERGNSLSQGQRQLISFARALLYQPKILILDEATASIDSESEQLVQKAIDTLIQGRSAIIIAHRLSTIRKADTILVLEKGQLVEQGSHEALMDLGKAYYKLYTAAEKQAAV